jgi:hypothetical protein
MKNHPLIFLLFFLILFSGGCAHSPFDRGLNQLKSFVKEGKIQHLGYASSASVDSAWIDTSSFVRVYFIRADSIRYGVNLNESQMLKTNRRYYGVRVGSRLCSTIAFDSIPSGWVAVAFTDSSAISPFFQNHTYNPIGIVLAPALGTEMLMTWSPNGWEMLPSQSLRDDMKPFVQNFRDSIAFWGTRPIPCASFLQVAQTYLNSQ